jgi:hypothetical protein
MWVDTLQAIKNRRNLLGGVGLLTVVLTVLAWIPLAQARNGQQRFTSPEKAVQALITALQSKDMRTLRAIFGADGEELMSSGDAVADMAERERFVAAFRALHRLEPADPNTVILHVGSEEWPFPIPLVKMRKNGQWRFDTAAGKEEILNRRIGQNELQVVQTLHAYVDAQQDYYRTDRDADQIREYAHKLVSTPGAKDGLYWKMAEGEALSPLGPLVAGAVQEGYHRRQPGEAPVPYHGYFFKLLKRQGEQAPGGAYDYIVNDDMLFGFAMVAYPAEYGASGIMTFLVNHQDKVYEKDLGECTEAIVQVMTQYNPDETWKQAE